MDSILMKSSVGHISYLMGLIRDKHFAGSDMIAYAGAIDWDSVGNWREELEKNALTAKQRDIDRLIILLSTNGGVVSVVERMVNMTRHFYETVDFVVLGDAMSAGTVWVMSGDNIYMNYASALGPIDPQVPDPSGSYLPALGYLDKVAEIIKRSEQGSVSQAELMLLQQVTLGEIRMFEQARDLSVSLLTKWLVQYKFKNWVYHSNGMLVTEKEKETRAREIAQKLSDNKVWHSHSRFIDMNTLRTMLKLKIEDFSDNLELCQQIDLVDNMLKEFCTIHSVEMLVVPTLPAYRS